MNHFEIIKKIHVSEKAGKIAGLCNMSGHPSVKPNFKKCNKPKVVFEVDVNANKSQIKRAVEHIYDTVYQKKVKAVSVNTITGLSKWKRVGKHMGKTSSYKKAIVTFRPEDKNLVTETV